MTAARWRESAPGSGVWILGRVDDGHVRIQEVAGRFLVYGMMGPAIELYFGPEGSRASNLRRAKVAGRLALAQWPQLRRRIAARSEGQARKDRRRRRAA